MEGVALVVVKSRATLLGNDVDLLATRPPSIDAAVLAQEIEGAVDRLHPQAMGTGLIRERRGTARTLPP
ncbi:hypothetical protein KY362_06935, partial [Candidatus Woesearchaeota archaeon]|nr:hypothetical protein [Candidatus Woesearchaeota archaeon]